MYKYLSGVISFCAILCAFNKTYAQTDTTDIDLGRLHLKKQFTQTVTIKGEDLEHFPFTNLTDAINVWFYGTNTSPATLTYVIDGMQINDVNTYHIHDIESITLVQSALSQTNGGLTKKQLVVIRLRKNFTEKSGITALGQTSIIDLHHSKNSFVPNSTTTVTPNSKLYNNYYISGFKNTRQIHYGASFNYLLDGPPNFLRYGYAIDKPLHLERLRINAYLSTDIEKPTRLDFIIGYTPQSSDYTAFSNQPNYINSLDYQLNQKVFNTALTLTSKIVKGFGNELKAGYNDNRYNYNLLSNTNGSYTSSLNYLSIAKYNNTVLSDELRYNQTFGNWLLEPKAGVSYQNVKLSVDSTNNSGPLVTSKNQYTQQTEWITISPNVSLSYKGDFNIAGGFQYLTSFLGHNNSNIYPFASLSVDVWHLISKQNNLSLMLYGSYAKSIKFANEASNLNGYPSTPFNGLYFNNPVSVGGLSVTLPNSFSDNNNTYNTGATFKTKDDKLTASYTFEKRNFTTAFPFPAALSGSSGVIIFYNSNYQAHYINIQYRVITYQKLNWYTGINGNLANVHYYSANSFVNNYNTAQAGDHIITGGWVNRINANKFFAGADVLYQVGGHLLNSTDKINSFSLQNLYAGFYIKLQGIKKLELYASVRNLLQNTPAIITDNRRFYGLGFKAAIE